ncbi:MAG: DUF485 domain-containing protein [Planctomycetaceae bacterium]|nr:DUF485 domain-containing protein [Planctomycetaceae bacterium]
MQSANAKLGLRLFSVYLVLYGGFVLVNTFSAETMELTPIAGINLAVLSGFGLIIAALVMAMIYGVLCQAEDEPAAASAGGATGGGSVSAGEAGDREQQDGGAA